MGEYHSGAFRFFPHQSTKKTEKALMNFYMWNHKFSAAMIFSAMHFMSSFGFVSSCVLCRSPFIAIFMFCSLSNDFPLCRLYICLCYRCTLLFFAFFIILVFVVVVAGIFVPFGFCYSICMQDSANKFERAVKSWVHSHQLTVIS